MKKYILLLSGITSCLLATNTAMMNVHMGQNIRNTQSKVHNVQSEILPDLKVVQIKKIKNKPLIAGDKSQGFVVFIKNIGLKDIRNEDINVKLTYGNKTITRKFRGLGKNHTKELKIAPVVFEDGGRRYELTATVDYNNRIKERNENNNKLSKTFYVTDKLVIKSVTVQVGRNGHYLYMTVKTNIPIMNMHEVLASVEVEGHKNDFLVHPKLAHKVDSRTYVFGPVDLFKDSFLYYRVDGWVMIGNARFFSGTKGLTAKYNIKSHVFDKN